MSNRKRLARAARCRHGARAGGCRRRDGERRGAGIDPNQGESLVEVTLANKAAALSLQAKPRARRRVQRPLPPLQRGRHRHRDRLRHRGRARRAGGRRVRHRRDDRGPATWQANVARRCAARRGPRLARPSPRSATSAAIADDDEIVVLRVDYFENYAGRFLSVEAKTASAASTPTGRTTPGRTLSLSWNTGAGTPIDSPPRPMNVNIDPDTTPTRTSSTATCPDRRLGDGPRADDDPHRPEHGRAIEATSTSGWAAACRR